MYNGRNETFGSMTDIAEKGVLDKDIAFKALQIWNVIMNHINHYSNFKTNYRRWKCVLNQ